MTQPIASETPAPTEHTFFFAGTVTVDMDSWRAVYGADPITPESVAQWLTFQFINGVQQGMDVLTVVEVPEGAPSFSKVATASSNT